MDDEKPSLPLSFALFERMTEPERRPLLIKYTDRLDFYLKDGACQNAARLEFDLDMFEPGRIYAILRDIGIYCIAGYVCALLFMPSLKVAMFIWGLCCAIDNIGWLVVYHRNKDKFTED